VARAGSFGRLPRQAPDLSGAIAALQREAQARFDSNMVDAWKNGGKVQGKAVTDDRLLAHFRKRRGDLSPTDPLWDEWNNRVIQYKFSIDESKLMVKWDNGKVSQAQVSQFYKNWMEKTPKNTEFYRTLAKQAGKWGAAARGRSGGRSSGSSAAAHAKWADQYYERHVKKGDIAKDAVLDMAKAFGAAAPDADDLGDIYKNSVGYQKLLDVLDGGVPDDPAVKAVMDRALKGIKTVDPNWEWSQKNVSDALDEANAGAKKLISNSTSIKEKNYWTKLKGSARWAKGMVDQADEMSIMFDAAEDFSHQMSTCGGDYACERRTMTEFRSTIAKVESTIGGGANGGTSNPFITGPLAETRRQLDSLIAGEPIKSAGEPNIFDVSGGDSPFGTGPLVPTSKENADKHKALASGNAWISYEMSPTLTDPSTGLPALVQVVHDRAEEPPPINAIPSPGSGSPYPVQIPRPTGDGTYTDMISPPAYIVPEPVTGIAVDPAGNPIDKSGTRLFDKLTYIDPSGQKQTTFRVGTGSPDDPYVYSAHEPTFANGTKVTVPVGEGSSRVAAYTFPASGTYNADGVQAPDVQKNGEDNLQMRMPSGALVLGSYYSQKGAEMGNFVEKSYAKHDGREANQIVTAQITAQEKTATRLANSLDPADRTLGTSMLTDLKAARQVNTLTRFGYTGKALTDEFKALNSFDETDQPYVDQLTKRGFRIGSDTEQDLHARVNALKSLDQWEKDHPIATNTYDPKRPWFGGQMLGPRDVEDAAERAAATGQARANILNPQIKGGRLTVPGMPNGAMPGANVGPDTSSPDYLFEQWANAQAGPGLIGGAFGGMPSYIPPINAAPKAYVPPPTSGTSKPPTFNPPKPDEEEDEKEPTFSKPDSGYESKEDAAIRSRAVRGPYNQYR
jgi:hypothetical protein